MIILCWKFYIDSEYETMKLLGNGSKRRLKAWHSTGCPEKKVRPLIQFLEVDTPQIRLWKV